MSHVVRTLADLGAAVVLAPERHRAGELGEAARGGLAGVTLGARAVERRERVVGAALAGALVLDTTHARDGVLDVHAAARVLAPSSSAKKRVQAGDLLVSRLRPYLRQIAYVHPAALVPYGGRVVACSTEFYVLRARQPGDSLADLVPWLLAPHAQSILAAAQEGGHHPRVPREVLLAMRAPASTVGERRARARAITRALGAIYAAADAWRGLLG